MLKTLLYFLFGYLIVSQNFSHSQSETEAFSIDGKFTERKSQKGISDFTVHLFRAEDSTLVKTEVTDTNGHFLFQQIKAGNYFIGTEESSDESMMITD